MSSVLYIFTSFVSILINVMIYAMMARAILSWLPLDENPIEEFLYTITEPVVMPVRALLDRFFDTEAFPLDISFLVAMILLSILSGII